VSVHLRSEGDEILEAIQEMLTLAEQSSCRLHISHLKTVGQRNWRKVDEVLHLIEDRHLTFDCYPYIAGSTTLLTILPPFVLKGKGIDEIIGKLHDPGIRRRLKRIFCGGEPVPKGLAWDNLPALVGWENIVIADMPGPKHRHVIGQSLTDLASQQKKEPADVALDLLIKAHGAVRMINYYENEATLRKILRHPQGMIGTDTLLGGKVHPRVFGSYPKILHHYVFGQQLFPLEEAIAKMSGRPASLLGLPYRGLLQPGYAADIIIFDETFRDRATFDEPEQYPEGLHYVLINGEVKVDQDIYSTNFPGRLLTSH
jgi:N-acyl-D-aspartate/D-glutamate deacylase